MSTKSKVPATKVPKKKVVKLTKTQRTLFIKLRNDIRKMINDLNQFCIINMLSPKMDDFIAELGLDLVNEDWQFDAEALLFRQTKTKEEKTKQYRERE